MKTNRHSLMAKGIMVLLSLIVLIFAFTYSWFAPPSKPVDATGVDASVKANGDFEYAVGFYNSGTAGDYKITEFSNQSSTLNLTSLRAKGVNDSGYSNYNLLHDYRPIDITGDGRTLIRPAMSYGNSAINTTSLDYSIAKPNEQYISFDLYFRSKSQGISVMLGDDSYAKAGAEVTSGGSMTGANATNKSTYGDFSKDAIVGAVRVAFINYDYSDELHNMPGNLEEYQTRTPDYLHNSARFIWLPRPDLHLNANDTLQNWSLSVNDPAQSADKQHYFYNIFNCQPAKVDGYPSSDTAHYHIQEAYSNTVTPDVLDAASQAFSDLNIKFGEYYYTKVNVRIWIEGTDIESRRATSGGQFEVNFEFTTS